MGGLNVKNTIVERVLHIVAPHPCSGCTKIGSILCLDCKYDIIEDRCIGCILCGEPQMSGICSRHESPIQRAFVSGVRGGTLELLINKLKFQHTKAASFALAELLDETLPILPSSVQIVPIPTVASHTRQRGYDQVELIARQFAFKRSLPLVKALQRETTDTQHLVGRNDRQTQASKAFSLSSAQLHYGSPVLLIDDIITTGSTLQAAASLLASKGYVVWVAALAYQPLD